MSAQVLYCIGLYRRRVPQGIFKENDGFPAIIIKLLTLRVVTPLLQGKRNCRVVVKIRMFVVRACSRLGDERLKALYIATSRRESYNDFSREAKRAQTQPLKTAITTTEQDIGAGCPL